MIRVPIKPFLRTRLLWSFVISVLVIWGATATVWAYRNRPVVILIGLDDAGTRLITSDGDPLIARERVKFIREFLRGFYNYDSADYAQTMSQTGALMSDLLWREREPEIRRTIEQMKEKPVMQEAQLIDLREVTEREFEADLVVRIRSRLQERNVKYRVALQIAPKKRSAENPYPLEVTSIHESEMQ
jgi:hypothetical protein